MLPTAGRSTAGIRGRLTNAACALGKALASKHTPAYAFRPTHMCTIFGSSLHQTALAATLPKPRRPSRPRWLAKACLAERPGAMGCHRGRQATARSEVGDRALSISRCHGLSRLSQAVTAVTAVTRCHERNCPRYAKTIAGGVYSGGMLHQKLSFAILPLPQVPNYNGYKTLYPWAAPGRSWAIPGVAAGPNQGERSGPPLSGRSVGDVFRPTAVLSHFRCGQGSRPSRPPSGGWGRGRHLGGG